MRQFFSVTGQQARRTFCWYFENEMRRWILQSTSATMSLLLYRWLGALVTRWHFIDLFMLLGSLEAAAHERSWCYRENSSLLKRENHSCILSCYSWHVPCEFLVRITTVSAGIFFNERNTFARRLNVSVITIGRRSAWQNFKTNSTAQKL